MFVDDELIDSLKAKLTMDENQADDQRVTYDPTNNERE
jgi:hypothetical protein